MIYKLKLFFFFLRYFHFVFACNLLFIFFLLHNNQILNRCRNAEFCALSVWKYMIEYEDGHESVHLNSILFLHCFLQ